MNSDALIQKFALKPHSTSTTQASESSTTLSPDSKSWNEAPLEEIVLKEPLLHEMSPEALTAYVQRCNLLRSSAQTRKAALRQESGVQKAPRKKKSNVEMALALLEKIKKERVKEMGNER
jgi:hypothetical protein